MIKNIDVSLLSNVEIAHYQRKVLDLYYMGHNCKAISKVVPIKLATIMDWVTKFSPKPINYPPMPKTTKGRKPKLNLRELSPKLCSAFEELTISADKTKFWTYKDLQGFLGNRLRKKLSPYQVKQILPYYFNLPNKYIIRQVFRDKYFYKDCYISYSSQDQKRWYYLCKSNRFFIFFSPRGDMKMRVCNYRNIKQITEIIQDLISLVKNNVVIIFNPNTLPLPKEMIHELELYGQVVFLKYDDPIPF